MKIVLGIGISYLNVHGVFCIYMKLRKATFHIFWIFENKADPIFWNSQQIEIHNVSN